MKKPKNMAIYLWSKLREYNFRELFFLELESDVGFLTRNIPGIAGYTLRYIVYKLFFQSLGSFCFIQPNVFFNHSFRITVGKGFIVNSNTYFHAYGGIDIGDNVLIGPNVVIASGRHEYRESKKPVMWQSLKPHKIIIGDGVWIGANAVIMPGVTVAKGTVVGAGAIVTKSTTPFSVVAGVPARTIGHR